MMMWVYCYMKKHMIGFVASIERRVHTLGIVVVVVGDDVVDCDT